MAREEFLKNKGLEDQQAIAQVCVCVCVCMHGLCVSSSIPEILFHNKVEVSAQKLRDDGHLTYAAHGIGIEP